MFEKLRKFEQKNGEENNGEKKNEVCYGIYK